MESGAMFDAIGDYRYMLWREWDERRFWVAIADFLNVSHWR